MPTPRHLAAAPAPATSGDRLADVDALRGFALLGILVVNATYFASAYHGTGVADPAFTAPLDKMVDQVVTVLCETKFYLLFSFLFGYSFTLQRQAAARRGARFTSAFLRRLATLFLIGVVHAVVLFTGDILTTYATLGLVLLALGSLRPRAATIAAVVLLLLTAAGYAGLGLLQAAYGRQRTLDAGVATAQARDIATQLTGAPGQVVAAHLHDLPDAASLLLLFQAPAALAMFLFGLAAGTRTVLADPMRHRTALRRIQWLGFPLGLAGSLIYADAEMHAAGTPYEAYALAVDQLTAPLLAAAYAVTMLRLFHTRNGQLLARALAPAGRMALSNYLLQSTVLAFSFTGYGLAALGHLRPAVVLAVSCALYAAQLGLSANWMRTHAYGPIEWVLRAATNLSRPAWKRA